MAILLILLLTASRADAEDGMWGSFQLKSSHQLALSLVANSCTHLAQAHCTLTIHRQIRQFSWTRSYFVTDRFSRAFWHTQGYVLPMDTESLPRDTLVCNNDDWLPPGPGSKYPFVWAFQRERTNPMFRNMGPVLQYTLSMRRPGLIPLWDQVYALEPPESLGIPLHHLQPHPNEQCALSGTS